MKKKEQKLRTLRLHTEDNEVCISTSPRRRAYIARIRSRISRVTRVYCERMVVLVLRRCIAWIALSYCTATQKVYAVTSFPAHRFLLTVQVRDTSESRLWTRDNDDVAWSMREFANTRWNITTNRVREQSLTSSSKNSRLMSFQRRVFPGNSTDCTVAQPNSTKRISKRTENQHSDKQSSTC